MIINIDAETINKIFKVDVEEILTNYIKSFIDIKESVELNFEKQEDGSYTVSLIKQEDKKENTKKKIKEEEPKKASPKKEVKEEEEVAPKEEVKEEEIEKVEEKSEEAPSAPQPVTRRRPESLFGSFNTRNNK